MFFISEDKRTGQPIRAAHFAALIPVIGIFLWYRIPLLGEVICDTDIAGILYSGWGLSDGLLPYRDIFETKPPGTYFLFALVIKLFGLQILPINVLAILWEVGALLALFLLTAKMIDPKAGLLASAAYAFVSPLSLLNGICPNYETWALTPGLFGLFFLVFAVARPKPIAWAVLSGGLLGLSMSMKFQGVFFSMAAFVVWISYLRPLSSINPKRLISIGLAVLSGIAAVWFFYLAYYTLHGAASSLISAINPEQGAEYAKARSMAAFSPAFVQNLKTFVMEIPVLGVATLLALLIAPVALLRKTISLQGLVLLFSWSILTFIAGFFLKGLLADGHYYHHYLVLAIPGLCALFGFACSVLLSIPKAWPVFAVAITGALFSMALNSGIEFDFAWASCKSQKDFGTVADPVTIKKYRDLDFVYGISTKYHLRKMNDYIRENSWPTDTIFVWDPISSIYIYTQRRAPTYYYKPYFSSAHLPWSVHKEGDIELEVIRRKILSDLTANPPKFVLHLTQPLAEYPHKEPLFRELDHFLTANYFIDKAGANTPFTIWRKKIEGFDEN